jgi:hypothetical protein
MEIEIRETILINTVRWVTDNEGKKHLCHDPIYADWLERRIKQEAAESAKKE